MIVRVSAVLYRTALDSGLRFDNLYGGDLQSKSELFLLSCWFQTLVIELIWLVNKLVMLLVVCQLGSDIGCEDSKLWAVRFDPSLVIVITVVYF